MKDFIEGLIGLALIFGGLYYYFNYHDMGGGKVGDFMRDVKAVYEINKKNEQNIKPPQVAKDKDNKEYCAAKQKSCQNIANSKALNLREEVARSQSVSPDSIKIQRVELNSCGCKIVFYTPQGPYECTLYAESAQCN